MNKSNLMCMLDNAHIDYEIVEYSMDIEAFSGKAVSDLVNLDYKTLTLIHEHDLYLCVISVADELDLKKADKQIGVKSLEMVHVKDLNRLVVYERGPVSPIGAKKNKSVYLDKEVNNHKIIEISVVMFGYGIMVNKNKIVNYLKAEVKDLV